jgi:hypothetical protein
MVPPALLSTDRAMFDAAQGVAMKSLTSRLSRYAESLRFPWLVLLTSLLFVVNLFVPDAIPFIDEVLLGLVAVILGRVKKKPKDKK